MHVFKTKTKHDRTRVHEYNVTKVNENTPYDKVYKVRKKSTKLK